MKILFVIDSLRKGGIRTSLLNLLANLDYQNYDIYLFCFHITEDDEKYIPSNVHVIKPNKFFNLLASTGDELKQFSYIRYFFRGIFSAVCKIFNSNNLYNLIFKTEKRQFKYDIAISYTNNVSDHSLYFGSNKFVIEKVDSRKKITWLHADYHAMRLDTLINNNEYNYFDTIVCVSKAVANSFIKYNKHLENKIKIIYNLLDINKLEMLSNENINEMINKDMLNCISVMRLDENKDPLFIIDIAIELKKNNVNFCWRILGDGPLFNKTKYKIEVNDLKNNVILYGYVNNPYPYLKKSDLYISTSKSEGFGLSIVEALYFDLDVLCAKYDAVDEVLDNKNGMIINKSLSEYVNVIKNSLYKRNKHYILHSNEDVMKEIDTLLNI